MQNLAASTNPAPAISEPPAPSPGALSFSNTPSPASTPVTEAAPAAPEPAPVPEVKAPAELKKGFDALDDVAETQTEPAQQDPDAPPEDAKTPEAKNAWTRSRNRIKELETAQQAWEAEKKTLAEQAGKAKQFTEADPEWKAYQSAKARLEELEPVIARVAYTKTQAYKDSVESPRNHIAVAAKEIGTRFKIADDKMVAALTEGDPVRQSELLEEVSSEMDGMSKSRLYRFADDLSRIAELDERMASNAEAAAKEADGIERQRLEAAAVEQKAIEMRAISDSKDRLTKAASLFQQEGETAEDAVAKILSDANQTPFGEMDVNQKAFAIIAASLVPRMRNVIAANMAQIASLKKQIAGYAGATPRAGSGAASNDGGQKPMSFMDSLKAAQVR